MEQIRRFEHLWGYAMNSPVTVASGTFALEDTDFIDQEHLGAYVCKTITRYPKKEIHLRVYETRAGLLNSIGLQNQRDKFIEEELPLKEKLTVPLIVSFSGSSFAEFAQMLRAAEKRGRNCWLRIKCFLSQCRK